jgi:hypothetical protein
MGKGQRFEPASSNLCEFRPNPSGPDQKPAQGMFTATELRDWRRRVFTRVAVSSVDDARSHFALASGNCHAHTHTHAQQITPFSASNFLICAKNRVSSQYFPMAQQKMRLARRVLFTLM